MSRGPRFARKAHFEHGDLIYEKAPYNPYWPLWIVGIISFAGLLGYLLG